MPIGCHDVNRYALDTEFIEIRRSDVRDAPELHFAGVHGDHGIDLTINRNNFALVGKFDMLDQKKAFRQSAQKRKKLVHAIDDQSARQTAKDLIIDEAVRMGVIPE